MAKSLGEIVQTIDALVKDARPKDGSAPLRPVLLIGDEVSREWPAIRRALAREARNV